MPTGQHGSSTRIAQTARETLAPTVSVDPQITDIVKIAIGFIDEHGTIRAVQQHESRLVPAQPPDCHLTEHDDGLLHAITDDLACVTFKNSNAPTEVRDLLEKRVDLVGLIRCRRPLSAYRLDIR